MAWERLYRPCPIERVGNTFFYYVRINKERPAITGLQLG